MTTFDKGEKVFIDGAVAFIDDAQTSFGVGVLGPGYYVGEIIGVNPLSHLYYNVAIKTPEGFTQVVTVEAGEIFRVLPEGANLVNNVTDKPQQPKSTAASPEACCTRKENITNYISLMGKSETVCTVCGKTLSVKGLYDHVN